MTTDRHAPNAPRRATDRFAATLMDPSWVERAQDDAAPSGGDARVDLQLLRARADRILADRGTDAARAHVQGLDSRDILAGTIQDGTARGVAARLEEAIDLCGSPLPSPDEEGCPLEEDASAQVFTGKELARKRDILIASKRVRIRFSRRTGILLVDRKTDLHVEDFVRFEDQADAGCLDAFRPPEGSRPRIFSPAFLRPARLSQGALEDRLDLVGQLGRGHRGHPCEITLLGRKDEPGIRMTVRVRNRHVDHRLRIRWHGVPRDGFVTHRGTPGIEVIQRGDRRFVAATIVRACGRLRVGDGYVATPDAQIQRVVEHEFGFGLAI